MSRYRCFMTFAGRTVALVVCALVGVSQSSAAQQSTSSPPPNPATTGSPALIIRIQNSEYVPNTATVKIGQLVKFENDDATGHTATASDGSFDSGYLGKGETWQTSFSQARNVLFSDIYHTSMHGQITVIVN